MKLCIIYNTIDDLPLRWILVGYGILIGSLSFVDLIYFQTEAFIGLYYYPLFLPLFIILLLLLFKVHFEVAECPICGPFTVEIDKNKIIGKPIIRVDYICTECGELVDRELLTTENES